MSISATQSKRPDTRGRIVKAAYRVLSEEGFERATMKEIAREADVAPGLIHYHFRDKEALLAAVVREAGERYVREVSRMIEELPGPRLRKYLFREPEKLVSQEPEWYRIRYELFALALHTPALRESAQLMLGESRRCVAKLLEIGFRLRPKQAEARAALLLACFDGLALQKMMEPGFRLDRAYKAMSELLGQESRHDN